MAPLALVVDDDLLTRIDLAEMLRGAGFVVIEAYDAASALVMLQQGTEIDLLCTDVHMPGELDGIDLAVRLHEQNPLVKIIVISGLAAGRALPSETSFLAKPVCPSQLLALVQDQLGMPVRHSGRHPFG